ncbi:MAG: hypothetical protein LLG06_19725 [Desulfobacteraceae bacterium]|nr:hypothetical protein [Desulfobacteraceae bacterium]
MSESTIKAVSVGGIMIMGTVTELGGKVIVDSPRRVQLGQPDGAGRPQVFLSELLGSPKQMTVYDILLIHDVTDEGLLRGYREQVSGLTIAQAIPSVAGTGGIQRVK